MLVRYECETCGDHFHNKEDVQTCAICLEDYCKDCNRNEIIEGLCSDCGLAVEAMRDRILIEGDTSRDAVMRYLFN